VLSLGISGLRIEGQLDKPETITVVTQVYRRAIDSLRGGRTIDVADGLSTISAATKRPLSDGPFDFQSIKVIDKEKELARA
jgi:collagenase-like PrtC family protease